VRDFCAPLARSSRRSALTVLSATPNNLAAFRRLMPPSTKAFATSCRLATVSRDHLAPLCQDGVEVGIGKLGELAREFSKVFVNAGISKCSKNRGNFSPSFLGWPSAL